MKKFIAIATSALLAVLLVACSNGATPPATQEMTAYQLYTTANEKLATADSMESTMNMVINMEVAGQSLEMETSGTVKQVIRSETDIDMAMEMSTAQMGMSMDMNIYYKDGYYYMDMLGTKQKMAMPVAEMQQQLANQGSANIDFAESAVKDTVKEEVDGNTKITFTLDGSILNDMLDQQMSSMLGSLGDADVSMSIGDIGLAVIFDADSNIKTIEMDYIYDMEMMGESVKATAHATMEVVKIGGVTVSFPDDLDSYQEVDSSAVTA